MTPERQRIAIAEWCGWKKGNCGWWEGPQGQETPHLPDYINDLNAMHETLGKLESRYWVRFVRELSKIQKTDTEINSLTAVILQINATAAQRAEALLKTIGKWED